MLKIGHRGAPMVAPANTMASFRSAVEMGCHWVECDCRPSSNGVIVLAHDSSVTDASGRVFQVDAHSAAELSGLDLGRNEGVPTLETLACWAEGRCGVMADVKCEGWEREIGDALARLSTREKIAPGAGPDSRRRFREHHPELPLSLSVGELDEASFISQWDSLDTEGVTLEHPLITPDRIANLHARGILVFAWTVDDLVTLQRLADWGVDGLISNRADLLAAL